MSAIRANIAANMAGQAWAITLALFCTPFYIKLLGVEAYGLIAFFLAVQMLLQLLDLGVGATVNREMARSVGMATGELGPFVKTVESWYRILGIGCAVVLFFALPRLTLWWLQPGTVQQPEILGAARVFALLIGLQWATAFYGNALAGLQKQVAVNTIQIPMSALGSIGGLVFIWLGPRSVVWLLGWQAGTACLNWLVMRSYFWSQSGLRRIDTRSDFSILRRHLRFSLGMSVISATGLVITHLDKVVLSRLLPLESFAHYSIAAMMSRGLYAVITPVFSAYLPRLSLLVAREDSAAIRVCYHTATQVMAVLVLPLAAVLVLFPVEILTLWLRDPLLAHEVGPLVTLLALGTCLNALMNVPFALQLAHGNTTIGLSINLGLVVVLVPSLVVITLQFGAPGGAAAWAVANALYLLLGLPITHRVLLGDGVATWAAKDILPPLTGALVVVVGARALLHDGLGPTLQLTVIFLVWILATLSAAAMSVRVRAFGLNAIKILRV
jgi:O-antigen/teichoic acid export membrane protein